MKKQLLILFVLFLSLGSCISVKKVNTIINTKISDEILIEKVLDDDYLALYTDALDVSSYFSSVDKEQSIFVPAIVFWLWNQTLLCDINSLYFSNIFTDLLAKKAEESNLKEKLNGKRLEISLESIPTSFYYTDNGFVATLIFYYFYNYSRVLYGTADNLTISYAIYDKGVELKSGVFIENNFAPKFSQMGGRAKMIDNYVDIYTNAFYIRSTNVINTIFDEIP